MSDKNKSINTGGIPVLDFKKEYKSLFSPSAKEPEMVNVPAFKYIMVDGEGYPGTQESFGEKIAVLYGLAYTIRFALKKAVDDPLIFKVPPFSGLYCADDPEAFLDENRKHEWKWTLAMMLPDRVTDEVLEEARAELIKKKNPPYANDVYFKIYEEGLCAQIMHIGPYSEEEPTIKKLHDFFMEKGYTFNGRHNEIYIGDPRKSKPEKLKTIIRQPVKKAN